MHERLGACQFFLGSIRGKRREREGEGGRERDRWIPSETGGSPTGGKHGTRVANDQTCFL